MSEGVRVGKASSGIGYESAECKAKGMITYINPNDKKDVVCAKINNSIPYINQYADSNGNIGHPSAGEVMCGANSVTMVAASKGKIKYNGYDDLKKYTYQDKGIKVNESIAPVRCTVVHTFPDRYGGSSKDMYNIGGSFKYVGDNYHGCSSSLWGNMNNYLKSLNISVKKMGNAYRNDYRQGNVTQLKNIRQAVDSGGGIIQGVSGTVGHIFVITGYTDDERFIVNDPYTNIGKGWERGNYNFSGRGAIYSTEDLKNNGLDLYWFISYK